MEISQSQKWDRLQMVIVDPALFQSSSGILPQNYTMQAKIPPQSKNSRFHFQGMPPLQAEAKT